MWKNFKKHQPPTLTRIKVKLMITGIGTPEREGWESTGILLASGLWSISQNESKTVDYRNPTHWDYMN